MTPKERTDEIAKFLYMGEIPDPWNIIASRVIENTIKTAIFEELMELLGDVDKSCQREVMNMLNKEYIYSQNISDLIKARIDKFKA